MKMIAEGTRVNVTKLHSFTFERGRPLACLNVEYEGEKVLQVVTKTRRGWIATADYYIA